MCKKLIAKYMGIGLLALYAFRGGCDHVVEDILNRQYAQPVVATRKKVNDFIFDKFNAAYAWTAGETLEERIIAGKEQNLIFTRLEINGYPEKSGGNIILIIQKENEEGKVIPVRIQKEYTSQGWVAQNPNR